jgi:trans-2,3-dihydro-3-hydroxyanthranilate isomerase
MAIHTFYQLDVFTESAFEGNPLAVFPDSTGLTGRDMQTIAREMNLSETVFVMPSADALRRLRIFTPKQELPLAGHPVVGTWNLLARLGVTPAVENGKVTIEQELGIGNLPVEIEFRAGEPYRVVMTQGKFENGSEVSEEKDLVRLAAALGLSRRDLLLDGKVPVGTSSTGISSLDVPVRSLEALGRIRIDPRELAEIYLGFGAIGCYAFTFETMESGSSVHSRFYAPDDGITEDPATGSAAGSLAGFLVHHGIFEEGAFTVEQGDFMGRRSRIRVEVFGGSGKVEKVKVGGNSVVVAKGELYF